MKTTVVNIKHDKYDVRIDRTTPFGNPIRMGRRRGKGPTRSRDAVIAEHKHWLRQWWKYGKEIKIGRFSNKWQVEHLHLLKGKRIGCFCTPMPCHGDNYVELLEKK